MVTLHGHEAQLQFASLCSYRVAWLRAVRPRVAVTRGIMRVFATLLWMGAIFALSSWPGATGSRTASLFADWNHLARTAAHAIEFGVLGVLICRALDRPNALPFGRRCALAFGLAALYGITDELHQTLVPGRFGKWQDVLLDAASAGLFILVWWAWKRSRISDEESAAR